MRRGHDPYGDEGGAPGWPGGTACATVRPGGSRPTVDGASAASWTPVRVMSLVAGGHLAEARALAESPSPDVLADAECLTALAVALLEGGDPGRADVVAGQALAADGLHAPAYHVLALCRERAGDPGDAARLDEVALSLEPDFALARLHLGRMKALLGQRARALAALRDALAALGHEDEARLALFGGGFGRGALAGLCRSEIQALRPGRSERPSRPTARTLRPRP